MKRNTQEAPSEKSTPAKPATGTVKLKSKRGKSAPKRTPAKSSAAKSGGMSKAKAAAAVKKASAAGSKPSSNGNGGGKTPATKKNGNGNGKKTTLKRSAAAPTAKAKSAAKSPPTKATAKEAAAQGETKGGRPPKSAEQVAKERQQTHFRLLAVAGHGKTSRVSHEDSGFQMELRCRACETEKDGPAVLLSWSTDGKGTPTLTITPGAKSKRLKIVTRKTASDKSPKTIHSA